MCNELTKEQLKEFDDFISDLSGIERYNLCDECHDKYGCNNNHDIHLYDTGRCSFCGKTNDIVNCAIANKVIDDNIKIKVYWRNGKRIIRQDGLKGYDILHANVIITEPDSDYLKYKGCKGEVVKFIQDPIIYDMSIYQIKVEGNVIECYRDEFKEIK